MSSYIFCVGLNMVSAKWNVWPPNWPRENISEWFCSQALKSGLYNINTKELKKSTCNCGLLIINKLKNKCLTHEPPALSLAVLSETTSSPSPPPPLHPSVLAQCCLLSINKLCVVNTKRCITTVKQTNKCTLTLAQRDNSCILSLSTTIK